MITELVIGAAIGAYLMHRSNKECGKNDPVSRTTDAVKAGIDAARIKWNESSDDSRCKNKNNNNN